MMESEGLEPAESRSVATEKQMMNGDEEEGQIEEGNDKEGSIMNTGV